MSCSQTFTIVYNETMTRIDNPNAQLVFYWLCFFRNSISDLCCPSIPTICKKSHLSKNSVKRALQYLNDIKIIQKLNKCGERNKYIIKDNKNKTLHKNQSHTGTSLSQGLGSPPQGLDIIRNNYTNKNTTTNYTNNQSCNLSFI